MIIAGYWLDLPAALWTVLLRTLLKLILANEGVNTYLGLPVNLVAIVVFTAILFWLLPHFNVKSLSRQVLAIVAATLGLTIAGVLMNWLVAVPLYAQFANFDIAKMIGVGKYFVGMVIPFNIAQGIIWGIVSLAILSLLKPIQHKVTA